jgi:cellulose synthase/poly-beta-1,6-N-acetylglucosamine synthase-like glycosyltransferase
MRVSLILVSFLAASYVYVLPHAVSMLVTSLAAIFYLKTKRKKNRLDTLGKPAFRRFLVAIPANNEEANIAETVRSCRAIQYPASLFDVLVISDNCTDNTASEARDSGARVLERFDATRKSKGYAIEYLIEKLRQSGEFNDLDALVIIDADSTVQSNLLAQFAMGLDRGSDWMQCYDCVGNPDRSWRTRVMAYGFSLFNGITLAGRKALGLSAGLRGNGMCISTNGLRRVPWQAHGLVEDLEYSWIVRAAGERVEFIEDTTVFATMLSQGGTPLANQRRRWEFGRISVCRKMLGPVLRSPHLSWLRKAAAIAELTTHPTSHVALSYLLLSAAAAFAIPGMISNKQYLLFAFIIVSHSIVTLALAIHALSPFVVSLVPWRFALSLGYFPYYIFWRLVVLAKGGPLRWIPTQRESNSRASTTRDGGHAPIPPSKRDKGDDRSPRWDNASRDSKVARGPVR